MLDTFCGLFGAAYSSCTRTAVIVYLL